MQWAFLDFGLRAVVLIEDIHSTIHKKIYSPPVPATWIAESFVCSRAEVAALANKLAHLYQIKGIIPWSETTLELAIDLMQHLNCQWIDPHVLSRFRNKYSLKNYLRSEHPQISMNLSWPVTELNEVLKLKSLWPKRFVIKPLDGMSNKKIGFFYEQTQPTDIEEYFKQAGKGRYVLEEFINGQEYAVNGQTDEKGVPQVYSILKYHHRDVNGRPNVYSRSQHLSSHDPVFDQLARYACEVVQALGLSRCPFHAEIRFDPARGPCLVEIAARPVGNELVQLMRDAHGRAFDPLRIAAHYYLSTKSRVPPPLNWDLYDRTQAINVDGITSKTGRIADLKGLESVERSPFFKRWVVKPEFGQMLEATQDLLSQPFSFQILGSDSGLKLMDEADLLEARVQFLSSEASLPRRLWASLLAFYKRFTMRWRLRRFQKTLRKV